MQIKQDFQDPNPESSVQFADLLDRARQANGLGLGGLGVRGGDYEWRIASGREVTPAGSQEQHVRLSWQ
jgi:hypothetical protein